MIPIELQWHVLLISCLFPTLSILLGLFEASVNPLCQTFCPRPEFMLLSRPCCCSYHASTKPHMLLSKQCSAQIHEGLNKLHSKQLDLTLPSLLRPFSNSSSEVRGEQVGAVRRSQREQVESKLVHENVEKRILCRNWLWLKTDPITFDVSFAMSVETLHR